MHRAFVPEKTFTTYEIARFCDVYPSSVLHWINGGKLKAYSTPGRHHRVTRENLLAFLNEFNIPIPRELASPEKKVLIVDDDVEFCRVLGRAFKRYPDVFKAEASHTGVDALIRIGQSLPDLVILDVVLPRMDGAEVCRILKSRPETRTIKIIGVSGKKNAAGEKKLDDYKVDAFFRKPLDLVQLLSKSASLLRVSLPRAAKAVSLP